MRDKLKILFIGWTNTCGWYSRLMRTHNKLGDYARMVTFVKNKWGYDTDIIFPVSLTIKLLARLRLIREKPPVKPDILRAFPDMDEGKFILQKDENKLLGFLKRIARSIDGKITDLYKRFLIWRYRLCEFDVYFLISGTTLLQDHKFLKRMKAKGKRIVAFYHGSDWRRPGGPREHIKQLADVCVVSCHELQRYAQAERIFIGIDTEELKPLKRNDKKLIIGHDNSSDRLIKGTDRIEAIFEKLKKKYDIETIITENLPNKVCLERKKQFDIFVDQILTATKNGKRISGYGTSALEALSFGIPTCGYLGEEFRQEHPEQPIIHVDFDTLEEKLIELIENKDLREEIGKRSREWVVKNHDCEVVVAQWRDLYRRYGFYYEAP